jgi:TolB-like protein
MASPNFFAELKRRNVYKVAVAYAVVAWLLIQIVTQVFPFFEIPNWAVRLVVLLLILGFPIALVLSWAFEITPEGIKRESEIEPGQSIRHHTGRKIVGLTIVLGIVAAGLLVFQLIHKTASLRMEGGAPATPNDSSAARTSLAGARPSIPDKSIAVLPFENLSEEKANAFFASGIQDEILTRLSKVAALKVISRTSTQKYKSAPANLREIGQQLGVANLLEGSVQKAGNAVHINVQLIKAATDAHIWAESYDRELQNIFGVEGEVATKIADAMDAKLTGAEEKAIAVRPTNNVDAYNAYLRGRAIEATRYDLPGEAEVGADFQEAVQLDPSFALAWADLTVVRCFLYYNSYDVATNSPAAIKQAADRAMALQPELGESWIAQGDYRRYVLRDYPGALQAYAEAEKRIPNSAELFGDIALVERRMGRWDAAVSHFRKAILLDPRNLQLNIFAGETFGYLRNFAESEDFVNRALQISTDTPRALMAQTTIFQAEGRLDDAGKAAARILQFERSNLEGFKANQLFYERRFDAAIVLLQSTKGFSTPGSPLEDWQKDFLPLLGYCQQLSEKTADAHATYLRAIQEIKPSATSVVPVDLNFFRCGLALAYAGLGEKEKALAEARQAVTDYSDDAINKPNAEIVLAQVEAQVGDIDAAIASLPHLLEVPAGLTPGILRLDPYWDPLRKDPRFQELCERPQ